MVCHIVPTRDYPSARTRILDAAERVVLRDGLGRLGIEAILKEAKVSKGGFFHHFASKDALLAALTERLAEYVAKALARAVEQDREPGSATLRAQIALAFDMRGAERKRLQALVLAMIEAAKTSPAVAESAQQGTAQLIAAARREGVSAGNALAIQLALDGYWIGDAIGSLRLSRNETHALRDTLLSLTVPEARAVKGGAKSRTRTERGRTNHERA